MLNICAGVQIKDDDILQPTKWLVHFPLFCPMLQTPNTQFNMKCRNCLAFVICGIHSHSLPFALLTSDIF